MKRLVIVRVHGGLGNQYFCYAFGRALAAQTNSMLLLDTTTGFKIDKKYRRELELSNFLTDDLSKYSMTFVQKIMFSRLVLKAIDYFPSIFNRYGVHYKKEKLKGYDPDVLNIDFRTAYFSGYWQSELYFNEIAGQIKECYSLRGILPKPGTVALHLRFFSEDLKDEMNLGVEYYRDCLFDILSATDIGKVLVFSDRSDMAIEVKNSIFTDRLSGLEVTICQNDLYGDLVEMHSCEYFIGANSTLSWWVAWFGEDNFSKIYMPNKKIQGQEMNWGFESLLPTRWELVSCD